MLLPHFVPTSFVIRAIFLRALLYMVLMLEDQVAFLTSFLGTLGCLAGGFLSIDLQDELFSLGRQREAGDLSSGSVDLLPGLRSDSLFHAS